MAVDIKKIQLLAEPVLKELGCEWIEARLITEYGRKILRIAIDKEGKEGGVSVGDCERVSREIETLLEVEEVVGERYLLEVSSPGLERPLIKEADYLRFVGKIASLKTREPIEGRRNYKGLLEGLEEGIVKILIDGKQYKVPVELIERAHLVV